MKKLSIFAAAGLIMCLAACSGSNSGESTETDTIVPPPSVDSLPPAPAEMPDTFATPKEDPEVKKASPKVSAQTQELRSFMESSPDADKYAEGILGKIADEAPSYAAKIINSSHDKFIVCDKNTMRVYLYDRYGREIKSYGMCCGRGRGSKSSKGDCRTPEGCFDVEGIYDSTDWLYTDDNGHTSKKKGQFGPRFIRVRTPVTMSIGIHGTCAPGSIGHRSSHGCMRLTNESILDLVPRVSAGMIVIVNPSAADAKVNKDEGRDISRLAFYSKEPPADNTKEEPKPKEPEATPADTIAPAHDEPSPARPVPAGPDTIPA